MKGLRQSPSLDSAFDKQMPDDDMNYNEFDEKAMNIDFQENYNENAIVSQPIAVKRSSKIKSNF